MSATQFQPASGRIPFERLTPDEKRYAMQCAQRAANIVREVKKRFKRDDLLDPDTMLIAMDICTTHLSKGLNLYGLLLSDDLTFWSDFVTITKYIDRACGIFPAEVRLACQRDS